MYTLISTERKVAAEWLRCDAYGSWEDWLNIKVKSKNKAEYNNFDDFMKLYDAKKGIHKGREYIERIFVNEEGQQYFLNSLPAADRTCIQNEIYHPEILNQIK